MIPNPNSYTCAGCGSILNLNEKIVIKSLNSDNEETICESCLKRKNDLAEKEVEDLENELKELEDRIKSVEQDTEIMKKKTNTAEMEQMAKSEIEILKQISALENEQEAKKREINDLVEKVLDLEKKEEKYWEEINDYEQQLYELEEKKSTYDKLIKNLEGEIARLNEVNVLNDVFKISAVDEVGTVNGLRIGKMKSDANVIFIEKNVNLQKKVNWEETNAGLGHIIHFFAFLLEKFKGFKFKKVESFEINGSFSKIKGKIGDSYEVYEIYGVPSNEMKFNFGLQLLMSCVVDIFEFFRNSKEFNTDLQLKNTHLELPHRINEFEIGDLSIRLESGDSKWDKWTAASKYLLTDIKYLIYLISIYDKHYEEKESLL